MDGSVNARIPTLAGLDPVLYGDGGMHPLEMPRVTSPEGRLCLALIKDAWRCLNRPYRSSVRQSAQQFFIGPIDKTAPITREHACAILGIDPGYLGKRVIEKLLR
jgi:hypothetical protein